jgi:hypothetical protein
MNFPYNMLIMGSLKTTVARQQLRNLFLWKQMAATTDPEKKTIAGDN